MLMILSRCVWRSWLGRFVGRRCLWKIP